MYSYIYISSLSWSCFIRLTVITMANRSHRNLRYQYISYWDILTIAIVIWILINTSISLAFVFIDFPLCWMVYRFVWWAICSRILSSQNSLEYCSGVISAAFFGGGLNYFPLNKVSKTIGSFFLHLQTRFWFLFDDFLSLIS